MTFVRGFQHASLEMLTDLQVNRGTVQRSLLWSVLDQRTCSFYSCL